jgi:Fe-S-cluster containining protein
VDLSAGRRVLPAAGRGRDDARGARGRALAFAPHADPRFVRLLAAPCPLYANGCTVYDVRPYNCRRFACQRTDYDTQAYDQGPQTRQDVRQLVVLQRHAQRWGRTHGWAT